MTLMLFMFLMIFGTWGIILFNGISVPTEDDAQGFSTHANFVDFRSSATTIIRIATLDGWVSLYTDAYTLPYVSPPHSPCYVVISRATCACHMIACEEGLLGLDESLTSDAARFTEVTLPTASILTPIS